MSIEVSMLGEKLLDIINVIDCIIRHNDRDPTLDEYHKPWRSRMDGPYQYVVFNNETGVISEVADPKIASGIAGGTEPVDAGMNIKLYVNDLTTRRFLATNWGVSSEAIRIYSASYVCARRWLINACVTYIRTTAYNGVDNPYDEHISMQNRMQRHAIAENFLELVDHEERLFGPGSDPKNHIMYAKYVSNLHHNDAVNGLSDKSIKEHQETIAALQRAQDEDDGAKAGSSAQAAKEKKNQKKYAKKKASKQNFRSTSKDDRCKSQRADVSIERLGGDFEQLNEEQLVSFVHLWRAIMGDHPWYGYAQWKMNGWPGVEAMKVAGKSGRGERLAADGNAKTSLSYAQVEQAIQKFVTDFGLDDDTATTMRNTVTLEANGNTFAENSGLSQAPPDNAGPGRVDPLQKVSFKGFHCMIPQRSYDHVTYGVCLMLAELNPRFSVGQVSESIRNERGNGCT